MTVVAPVEIDVVGFAACAVGFGELIGVTVGSGVEDGVEVGVRVGIGVGDAPVGASLVVR